MYRNMKHMQKRLRNDELRVLRGEVEVDETQLDDDMAALETSASEGELQPVRQAPAGFISVNKQHSMHTTDKGAGQGKGWCFNSRLHFLLLLGHPPNAGLVSEI